MFENFVFWLNLLGFATLIYITIDGYGATLWYLLHPSRLKTGPKLRIIFALSSLLLWGIWATYDVVVPPKLPIVARLTIVTTSLALVVVAILGVSKLYELLRSPKTDKKRE